MADRLVRISDAAARMTAQLDELREDAGASLAAQPPGAPPEGARHNGSGHTGSDVEGSTGAMGELVDLAALAHEAIAAHSEIAGQHRIVLRGAIHDARSSSELRGRWSAVRLARVIDNLLSNAIKYSPNRSTVTVTLRREHANDGEWAVLEVADEGIGIPAADLPRVFDRFYRATNVPSLVTGSGIGLAAVRESVERMGGRVNVESNLGKGSTFTVRLPLPARQSLA
jgi:signal transduction histidine kinase